MKTQSKYDPPRKTWAQFLLLRVWEESAFNIMSRLMSQLNIPATCSLRVQFTRFFSVTQRSEIFLATCPRYKVHHKTEKQDAELTLARIDCDG